MGHPLQHGYHLLTGCNYVNQGKAAHQLIETTIKTYFKSYTNCSARTVTSTLPNTNRKPDILISNLSGTNNRDTFTWTSLQQIRTAKQIKQRSTATGEVFDR